MPPLPSADALEDAGNNVWAGVDDAYVSQLRASPPQSPAARRDAGASLIGRMQPSKTLARMICRQLFRPSSMELATWGATATQVFWGA